MFGFLIFVVILALYCFVGGITFYKVRATTPRDHYGDTNNVVAGFAGGLWPLGLPVWAGIQAAKKMAGDDDDE